MKKRFSFEQPEEHEDKSLKRAFGISLGAGLLLTAAILVFALLPKIEDKTNLLPNNRTASVTPVPRGDKPVDQPVKISISSARIVRNPTLPTAKPQEKPTSAFAKMSMPVVGGSGMHFATTSLIYSKTLRQWMTHSGIDFTCDETQNVVSVLAGTVSGVRQDALMGYTLEIDHGKGNKTLYACLSQLGKFKVGDTVTQGQIVGKTGASGIGEIEEGNHLHFEIWQNGKPIDPATVLPE